MKWTFYSAALAVTVTVICAQCVYDDTTLLNWNDPAAWKDEKAPASDGVDATLIGRVLLNSQPPTIHHLTISSGAQLVFDPKTDVHLKVHALYVEGEVHIGSETCLFEGDARITFIGEVNEDKVLLVKAGGTLQVHGQRKLPWTKLAQTAPKLMEVAEILEGKDNLDFCNDKCNRGLMVYQIDPNNGQLIEAHRFDFTVLSIEIDGRILEFLTTIRNIPNGQVVGIGLKQRLSLNHLNYDLSAVFEGIEALAFTGAQTQLRNVDQGSAYSMMTVKGSPGSTVEVFEKDVNGNHAVEAKLYYQNKAYVMESFVTKKGRSCSCRVDMRVYDDALYRPTLTLLDDVSTWKVGDRLVMASTDYNFNQAEEVTVMSVMAPNQIRLSDPLKYTHYGQIYKGVDMRGEVGLLSRNVKFDSEEASTSEFYGGHIKILKNFASVHIEGAELEDLGQQEVLGSYSIHFHACGDVDDDLSSQPWIRQNSIHHTNSRCVTIHNTMGVLIEENVCYKSVGHSYFLEDGSEQRNVFDGNLGLGTEKPPQGRGLIKTDNGCPTTFWITNPKNSYRNNVAAGSHCRGFWFNYPDLPLNDDPQGRVKMLNREARFTAIYQYENNVAHSNGQAGLFVDNILKPSGDSNGYNKYRPMKNPVENNCINKPNDCEEDCVSLKRYTGYKNKRQNAWIRGGCVKLVNSSLSDSLTGAVFLKDNPSVQYLEGSIVIGDSDNYGEPESFLLPGGSLQRSFPFGHNVMMRTSIHMGVEYKKGPTYINSVWFDDFKDTEEYYKMGAFGFSRNAKGSFSTRNAVTNTQFGFSDPSEGNRVYNYGSDEDLFTEKDGDDTIGFRDPTNTVSEALCPSGTGTVVNPDPFHMTSTCKLRDNWNMAWCCNSYGQIRILDSNAIDNKQIVTMVRDDDITNTMDSDMDHHAPFLVALGGKYSYTMFFNDEIPQQIRLQSPGISNTEYVRLGVCLPPNAQFGLKKLNPHFRTLSKWTSVSTLAELDADTVGDKYFYHAASGYFATIIKNTNDFLPGENFEFPRNRPCMVFIDIESGDRQDSRCIDRARQDLGDLSPQITTVAKRSLRSILMAERSNSGSDSRVLPADITTPPTEWGVHSSHIPWKGQPVTIQ